MTRLEDNELTGRGKTDLILTGLLMEGVCPEVTRLARIEKARQDDAGPLNFGRIVLGASTDTMRFAIYMVSGLPGGYLAARSLA